MFQNFQNILIRSFDNSFPTKLIGRTNISNNWITNGIKISCKRKRELYLLKRNSNNPQAIRFYNKYCSILKNIITEAKKMHIRHQIHHSDNLMKTTWKVIKDSTGATRPPSPITKINTDNKSIEMPDEIAQAFNNFFIHVVENSDNKQVDRNRSNELLTKTSNPEYTEMKVIPITENEVLNTILALKTKKSSGYDGISNRILKHCATIIIKPLSHICNSSLTKGIFPDRCKYALVLPIHKKGERTDRSNYRPISLILSLSKVLEILMHNRLNQHLNSNNIIALEQYGFRKEKNIDNAIFSLTNTIANALNKKQVIAGLFCDLSKAFDSVNHSISLQKLSHYGVRNTCHSWFKSYLTNRQQKVVISTNEGKHTTNWDTVNSGVPQGSVLGPLLFLLYINDLPDSLRKLAIPVIYADDTSLLIKATNAMELHDKVNNSIYHIKEWFAVNGLTLNLDKTNIIKFSSKTRKETSNHFSYLNTIKEMNNLSFLDRSKQDIIAEKPNRQFVAKTKQRLLCDLINVTLL